MAKANLNKKNPVCVSIGDSQTKEQALIFQLNVFNSLTNLVSGMVASTASDGKQKNSMNSSNTFFGKDSLPKRSALIK